MKKNGFTLVELLAVITLISVISLIAMPAVQESIYTSKQKAYDTQISNIKKAAKDWSSENLSYLPEEDGESITITLYSLMSLGYIEDSLINPKTDKYFDPNTVITITRKNKDYKYDVEVIFSNEKVEVDHDAPILFLNGDYVTYVEINDSEGYKDLGATSDISNLSYTTNYYKVTNNSESSVTSISINNLSKYRVEYCGSNDGKESCISRYVIVRDTVPPVITVPITQTISATEVASYNLKSGVSVTDNSGKSITPTITGKLETKPGKYVITYTATDASGNKKTKKRTIIVENFGSIVYFDPVDETSKCSSDTFSVEKIKNGTSTCYKWYIIDLGSNEYNNEVTLILDHNLINSSVWNSAGVNSNGPINMLNTLGTATASWKRVDPLSYKYETTLAGNASYGNLSCVKGTCYVGNTLITNLRARVITVEEMAAIANNNSNISSSAVSTNWSLDDGKESWFYFSNITYSIGTHTSGTGDNSYSWLLENTISNTNSGATDNAYGTNNYGYWTLSPYIVNTYDSWLVMYDGGLHYRNVTNTIYGIRPVITINKSLLR